MTELDSIISDIRRTNAELENAGRFLTSRYFEEAVQKAVADAVVKSSSPWLNRQAAAAYIHCGVSEIDLAADAGVITRYHRAGTPMFRKDEIDKALTNGEWVRREELKRRAA